MFLNIDLKSDYNEWKVWGQACITLSETELQDEISKRDTIHASCDIVTINKVIKYR